MFSSELTVNQYSTNVFNILLMFGSEFTTNQPSSDDLFQIELSSVCPPSFTDSELPMRISVHVLSSEIYNPSSSSNNATDVQHAAAAVVKSITQVNASTNDAVISRSRDCVPVLAASKSRRCINEGGPNSLKVSSSMYSI